MAQAQASLDAFCARVGDQRTRMRDGQRITVAALAELEPLAPLPPAFPATVSVRRVVTAQALVAFRGNSYSVPPGLAGATVTVSHRLGEQVLDIATTNTAGATVLARHRREPDGAGVLVRDVGHVHALATAVLAAFDTSKPCARKVRRPPSPPLSPTPSTCVPVGPSRSETGKSWSTLPTTPPLPASGRSPRDRPTRCPRRRRRR